MARSRPITFMRALALTAAAALTVITVASSADTPSPFVGTWVLSVPKSAFDPPPAPKSQTVAITQAAGSTTHVIIDTVEADGSSDRLEYTTGTDGRAVPVTGVPNIDSMTNTLVNPRTAKTVYLKAGKIVSSGTFTVSKSGKTMQGPLSGPNADGSVWKYHYVYARQ
jgi:hypothetical protein